MVRVLHVLNSISNGGVESFLMSTYRKINREKIQFDFLVRSDKNDAYIDEISSLGGRIFQLPPFPRNIIKNYKALDVFLETHPEYEIIHVHANSLIYIKPLQAAKKHNIPHRIMHSHSTKAMGGNIANCIHRFNKNRINRYATNCLACSYSAGTWMFNTNQFDVLYNGIDVDKFSFCETSRNKIRARYNLTNQTIIGHVGRFVDAKNHGFIIELFHKLLENNADWVLILVGDGANKPKIEKQIQELGIEDHVILPGSVDNVQDYLSAMDIFIFPSLYEGFPISFLEAQASGLPCVVSDRISSEAIINPNVSSLPLEEAQDTWMYAIEACTARLIVSEELRNFDSQSIANKLEQYYLTLTDQS